MIYFAPEPWDGLWRNRQQLMTIFARHNQVLFVEERRYLKQILAQWHGGKPAVHRNQPGGLRRLADGLAVLRYPAWAPVSGTFPLRQLTRTLRQLYLHKALHQLGMSAPICWFSRPAMVDLVAETPPAALRIYHVVDEYAAYVAQTPHSRQRTLALEQAMLQQVDLVLVVSEKLYEAKSRQHPHTYLVPNGVDYAGYTAALQSPVLPAAIAKIPAPRLGYVGLIGDKLDFELLLTLARHQPAWSLVFVGEAKVQRQHAQWQALCQLPNVYHIATVPAQQVPDYVKGFTVGLMPYLCNQQAEYISPLKLYDYLAAGLPIVAVDIPAVRRFAQAVSIATTPATFITAIETALATDQPQQRQMRRAIAAQHTWEQRAEQISTIIAQALWEKQSKHSDKVQLSPTAGRQAP